MSIRKNGLFSLAAGATSLLITVNVVAKTPILQQGEPTYKIKLAQAENQPIDFSDETGDMIEILSKIASARADSMGSVYLRNIVIGPSVEEA